LRLKKELTGTGARDTDGQMNPKPRQSPRYFTNGFKKLYAACFALALVGHLENIVAQNTAPGIRQEATQESRNVNPPLITPTHVALVATILCGGLGGSVFTWWISTRQNRKARIRTILAFLHGWRADIEGAISLSNDPVVITAYDAKRSQFVALMSTSSDLFADAATFQSLTRAIATIKAIQNDPKAQNPFREADRGKKYVLAAIDAFIAFVAEA
jgi:hypothetical protein